MYTKCSPPPTRPPTWSIQDAVSQYGGIYLQLLDSTYSSFFGSEASRHLEQRRKHLNHTKIVDRSRIFVHHPRWQLGLFASENVIPAPGSVLFKGERKSFPTYVRVCLVTTLNFWYRNYELLLALIDQCTTTSTTSYLIVTYVRVR